MALDTTAHDIYRGTSGITLPTDLANEIWENAQHESAIMQLAERIDLPGRGLSIPVITADPTASFVAESTEKPVSNSTFATKTMKPYKIAAIELVSNELMRDLPRLYDTLVRRLPGAIGKTFDATAFNGTAPGTGFDVLTSVTAVNIEDGANTTTYKQLVTVMETIAAGGYDLNGFALSAQGRAVLLGAVDTVGRPIFTTGATEGAFGAVLGARVVNAPHAYKAGTGSSVPNVVGFAGDWTKARWGIVGDIDIAISDQATVNDGTKQVNLWQRNMTAIRVEAEVGFVADTSAFVRLTTAYSA